MKNKGLLCIHYYFPPLQSGGVYRNYHFAQAFSKYFDKIQVLSTKNVLKQTQEVLPLENNIIVTLVNTFDYRSLFSSKNHLPSNVKTGLLYKVFFKIQKSLPFHFLVGEGGLIYIYSAYKSAKKLVKAGQIDMVYSSFMPYADHLIAYFIKKKFPHIVWVADFRDLQIEPLYKNIYFKKLNRRIEKYILKKADVITTISEAFVTRLNDYNECISVPRGISYRGSSELENDTFNIVYTGNLFGDFRDGRTAVKAIKKASNQSNRQLRFIHAGRDSARWKQWFVEEEIEELFEDRGYLSHQETLDLQSSADVLLLLTSSSIEYQGVFTGKLFEYLGTGVPILNIINGVYDTEFESLFNELNAGKIIYSPNATKASQFLRELIFDKKDNTYNLEAIKANHTWDARAKQILSHVNLLSQNV